MSSDTALSSILPHPISIAVSGAGVIGCTAASYYALLAAIPPDCLRGTLFDLLPYLIALAGLLGCQMAFALGLFLRFWPDPSFQAGLWFRAVNVAGTHALTFGLGIAVLLSTTIPAGCRSPSWIELSLIGLCQLGHTLYLCREAHRISRLIAREEAP